MVSRAVYFLWLYYLVAGAGYGLGELLCPAPTCPASGWASEASVGVFLLVLAVILLLRLRREAPELLRRPRPLELLGLPLWSVPVSWCFAVAAFALLPKAEGNVNLPEGLSPAELLPIWLLVAVVVPVLEETLFRGWLLRGLRLNDGLGTAVWLSAVVFGVAHILPAVALFAFGGGLVWARYIAQGGSLWATIFAHALTNSVPFVFLALDASNQSPAKADSASSFELSGLVPALVSLALGLTLLLAFFRRNPLPPERSPTGKERSIPLFLTLLGLGVALVLTLGTSF